MNAVFNAFNRSKNSNSHRLVSRRVMLRGVAAAVTGAAIGVGISIGYKIRNLKRDIDTIDPLEDAMFGTAGAAAALFARNPSFIIKQLPALYVEALTRFPMPVKSVTTGVTYAAGDLIAQSFEKDPAKGYDWERAAVFMAFGTILAGPVYTVWFDKIDRLPYLLYTMKQNARKQQIESILKYAMEKGLTIPAEIAKTPELHRITYVGSKILADQLVFSSLYTAYFFYGVGLLSGSTLDECKEEVKHKFVPTYATDCAVWPLLQMVNFTIVPQHLRVLYVNVCNIGWNSFLSTMANASHHTAHTHAPSHAPANPLTRKTMDTQAAATTAAAASAQASN